MASGLEFQIFPTVNFFATGMFFTITRYLVQNSEKDIALVKNNEKYIFCDSEELMSGCGSLNQINEIYLLSIFVTVMNLHNTSNERQSLY